MKYISFYVVYFHDKAEGKNFQKSNRILMIFV